MGRALRELPFTLCDKRGFIRGKGKGKREKGKGKRNSLVTNQLFPKELASPRPKGLASPRPKGLASPRPKGLASPRNDFKGFAVPWHFLFPFPLSLFPPLQIPIYRPCLLHRSFFCDKTPDTVDPCVRFGSCRCLQHGVDGDAVAHGGVVDHHVGHRADEPTIL